MGAATPGCHWCNASNSQWDSVLETQERKWHPPVILQLLVFQAQLLQQLCQSSQACSDSCGGSCGHGRAVNPGVALLCFWLWWGAQVLQSAVPTTNTYDAVEADVWALGIVLCHLFFGAHTPFW